jgi:diguanylate cyclase (GGDEF)-like protein
MTTLQLPQITPSMTFDEASRTVTAYLAAAMPWGSWSVSRLVDGQQTHVVVDDHGFGLEQGTVVAVEESLCQHMLAGRGPHIAPDAQAVQAYRPHAEPLGIKAYAGVPITDADGSLFGVLCGLSHQVQDAGQHVNGPLLELLAGLLGIVLASDRGREAAARRLAEAEVEAATDGPTGLPNRRAWTRLVTEEGVRHRKFGDPTAVVIVDLDQLKAINDEQGHAAGDAYISAAATALRGAVGPDHLVARLGGDEFGVLLRRTTIAAAEMAVASMEAAAETAGVAASIGWAPVTVVGGISGAMADADRAMYARRRARHRLSPPMPTVRTVLPDVATGMAFDEAAHRVVAYLHEQLPWGYWSIGRIVGEVQTHLFNQPNDIGVPDGLAVPLPESICVRMLAGDGPHVAPSLAEVPAYAEQPVTQALGLTAYAGMPITEADGSVFGVLCGLSAAPDPAAVVPQEGERLLRLLTGLLASVLAADRLRHAEELHALVSDPAHLDPITGLAGPERWHQIVEHATIASSRFGDPVATVRLVMSPDAPVAVLAGAAAVVRRAVGLAAVLVRADQRTIGIVLAGEDADDAELVAAGVAAALEEIEVVVDVSVEVIRPGVRTPPARTPSGS